MRLYRITFFGGLAVGYVLGARAGRERYEQLRQLARKAAENPAMQQAAGALQAQASATARSAKNKAANGVRAGVSRVGRRHGAGDEPAAAHTASGKVAASGNGTRPHHGGNGGHRPFVPANGKFGDRDII